jgi:exopolysaccharide biosynthesis protein
MQRSISGLLLWLGCLVYLSAARGEMLLSPWVPAFKGIDHSVGTNIADITIPRRQVAHCFRVDLLDPDVRLFTTPPAPSYVRGTRETLFLSVSNFLKEQKLAVASNCNFYDSNSGTDVGSEGVPGWVYGLQVCTGAVVSLPESGPDSNGRHAAILFTTNNQPIIAFHNRPPGASLEGIYTAVSGYYPILSNGVNIGAAARSAYPDSSIHDPQPRTVFGVSGDKRYLLVMTIDGRQSGYSEGALDAESAAWMIQFGAADAINMDGGGSVALYRSDCEGNPMAVNHSSYVGSRGRERYIGSHFGVAAPPYHPGLLDLNVEFGGGTATLTWRTASPASTEVDYGLTSAYGSSHRSELRLMTRHVVTLRDLAPDRFYYFRARSVSARETNEVACRFHNSSSADWQATPVFGMTQVWTYTTNNLDGVDWTAPTHSEDDWLGSGPGLLYVEDAANPVSPKSTLLPPGIGDRLPVTYYFRTRFPFEGERSGVSLVFSNFLDDGAVFYLNGREIHRLHFTSSMSVSNQSLATSYGCGGDATPDCPQVFTVEPRLLEGLLAAENVLAVEVHNYSRGSPDIVFGSSLSALRPPNTPPILRAVMDGPELVLHWNGQGYTLQRSEVITDDPDAWQDLPGNATVSPQFIPVLDAAFFRLRGP